MSDDVAPVARAARQLHALPMGSFVPLPNATQTRRARSGGGRQFAQAGPMLETNASMDERHQAWADMQPTVTRCGLCEGRPVLCEGTAAAGRTALADHRKQAHPESLRKRRRREPFESDRQIAEKEADRRAKLTGVDRVRHAAKVSARPIMRPAVSHTAALAERDGSAPTGGDSAFLGVAVDAAMGVKASPSRSANAAVHPAKGKRWTNPRVIEAVQAFHAAHGRTPYWDELGTNGLPTMPTFRARFGTFSDAVTAAGFTPRKRGNQGGGRAGRPSTTPHNTRQKAAA